MGAQQAGGPSWRVRPYQLGDEAQLVQLFEQVFHKPISQNHWRWKLKGCPSSLENVWVAEQAGKLVGQYAAMPTPCMFRYENAAESLQRTIMVGVDSMVHPEYRRQGVMTALVHQAHGHWAQKGVPLVLGVMNQRWGSLVQTFHWQYLFRLEYLHWPLQPEKILARRLGISFLARLRFLRPLATIRVSPGRSFPPATSIREVDQVGGEIDRLWQRAPSPEPLVVLRDGARLGRRYLADPDRNYRLLLAEARGDPLGYLVYRMEAGSQGRRAVIAELVTAPGSPGSGLALLHYGFRTLVEQGVESVTTLAIPGTRSYRLFRRAGFLKGRHSFRIRAVILDSTLSLESLGQPQFWDLGGGDFDFY